MTILRQLRYLLHKRRERQEMEEEMRLHRELRAGQISRDALNRDGLNADEAAAGAARKFGHETLLKERANDVWGWNCWKIES
jgi:hypothetical protein